MATESTTQILAVKEVSGYGYLIRASFNGLISRLERPRRLRPLIPPGPYPADLKCIRLRRPDERDNIDPKDVTDYPIAEPLDHVLTGVGNPTNLPTYDYNRLIQLEKIRSPRYEHRISEDRLCRVRGVNGVPSMVMKIAELPDKWPVQIASTSSSTVPGAPPIPFMLDIASPHPPSVTPTLAERDMTREIAMHQQVAAALGARGDNRGLVPAFYGLVTERGRGVVGFLSEYIEGSRTMYSLFREAADRGSRTGRCPRRSGRRAVRRCGRSMWRASCTAMYMLATSCAAVMAQSF
ncbi:hypothetical protein PG997_009140 [Apiospora hydei]|uniref:Uncharacterized protein n=1 Tax=Apiospora hydei TaxID=1337664 RepID=A0ABR1VTD3_9PEZI